MNGWTGTWRQAEIAENRIFTRGTQLAPFRLADELGFRKEKEIVFAAELEALQGGT